MFVDVDPLVPVVCVRFHPLDSSNRARRPPCFAGLAGLGTHCVGLAVAGVLPRRIKLQ